MALSELQSSERATLRVFGGLAGKARAWLQDTADRAIAQRMAGTAFLIRVFSAGLIYLA